jgi:hypothetical protein
VHIDGVGDVLAETAGEPGREIGRLLAVLGFEGTAGVLVEHEGPWLPDHGVGVALSGVVGPDTLDVGVRVRPDEEVRRGVGVSDRLPALRVLTLLSGVGLVVVVAVTRAGGRRAEQRPVILVNLAGSVPQGPGDVDGERPGDAVLAVGGVTGRPVEVDSLLVVARLVVGKERLGCRLPVTEGVVDDRPAVAEPVRAVLANVLNGAGEYLLVELLLTEYGEEHGVGAPAVGFVEGLLLEFFPGGEVRERRSVGLVGGRRWFSRSREQT